MENAIQDTETTLVKNKVLELEIRSPFKWVCLRLLYVHIYSQLLKQLEKSRQMALEAPITSYREPDRSHHTDQRSVLSLPPSLLHIPDCLPLTRPETIDATIRTADIKHHPQSIQAFDNQIVVLTFEVDAFHY